MGIISKVGLSEANPLGFSMDSYHCQFLVKGNILLNPEHYHRLVGRLINLFVQARTFLLCAYTCSIYVASKIRTLGVVLRVVCYLKGNRRQGILLCTDCDFQLYAQCDSDWANCPLTRVLPAGSFFLEILISHGKPNNTRCFSLPLKQNMDLWLLLFVN